MLEPVLLSPLHPFLSLSSLFLFNILLSHKATTQTPSEGNSTFSNGGFFFCNKMGPLLASGAAHSRRSHGHGYYPTDLWPQVSTHTQTLFQCLNHLFLWEALCGGFSQTKLMCVFCFRFDWSLQLIYIQCFGHITGQCGISKMKSSF